MATFQPRRGLVVATEHEGARREQVDVRCVERRLPLRRGQSLVRLEPCPPRVGLAAPFEFLGWIPPAAAHCPSNLTAGSNSNRGARRSDCRARGRAAVCRDRRPALLPPRRDHQDGNTHARRLLVEAAWHQRRPLRASATLEKRRQGQPAPVRRVPTKAPAGSTSAGTHSSGAASGARLSRSPSRVSSPATPGHAVPTPAYQPRHDASTTAACAPPAETKRPAYSGPPSRTHLTNLTPYQLNGFVVMSATTSTSTATSIRAIVRIRLIAACVSGASTPLLSISTSIFFASGERTPMPVTNVTA